MEDLCFHKFPRDENLKQQWLIKIKLRTIHSIQRVRMCHAYCFGRSPGSKKIRFQLTLNKTFCSTLPLLTHQRLKHRQRTKIFKKIVLSKYSILTIAKFGPPVSDFSTRISKSYAPTDSEHKFHKTVIENWLSIKLNLGSSWLGTCSHNHYTMFNH